MGACVNAHEAALQGLLQRAESDAAARVRSDAVVHLINNECWMR